MKILFTGAGTGGHVFPIIAVARQLKKFYADNSKENELEMIFLGAGGLSEKVLEKEGIVVKTILAGKLRRYFSFKTFLDFIKIPLGFCKSLLYLYLWMPDVIFSKGGYDSFPVVFVGWLYRIPILIHESDTIPGLANRLSSKFAKKIGVSFSFAEKYFPKKKTALIGNPIRKKIVEKCILDNQEEKQKIKSSYKIISQKPVILVLGGSQGAEKINNLILLTLPQLLEKYEIIHQCGNNNYKSVKAKSIQSDNYHLSPFFDENQLSNIYSITDLIISRSGAGSICEIAICGKPSILIPLPKSAGNHQRQNAMVYAQSGSGVVLEQFNLTPNLLLNEINKILNNNELYRKMSDNAKSFSRPEATKKISEELIELGKQ